MGKNGVSANSRHAKTKREEEGRGNGGKFEEKKTNSWS